MGLEDTIERRRGDGNHTVIYTQFYMNITDVIFCRQKAAYVR
jgi:hypothetical protein